MVRGDLIKAGESDMNLNLKPESKCKYNAVSLGEVMLRLDPGEGRIRTARSFRAWEGGGEYNVVRGLRKCFKKDTAVITAFADNEVGMLMEDFICQGGVDTSLIKWMKTDGIGRICRNGINFHGRCWWDTSFPFIRYRWEMHSPVYYLWCFNFIQKIKSVISVTLLKVQFKFTVRKSDLNRI